jgi:diguanylate cyclase (GGDEF)-like protein
LGDLQSTNMAPLGDASDPVAILAALDAVAYDWDIASDRIVWGPNVVRTLRELDPEALASGAAYAGLVTVDSETSRYYAVFNGFGRDEGEGARFRVQYRLDAIGGGALEVEDFGRWFADAEGRPARARGVVRVLGRAAKASADALAEEGFEHTLTSRRAFNAWVDRRCAEPRAPDTALALMVVGVGNLSEINLREGYDVGDELIAEVGKRLALSLRGGDRLVRYCGGKFALLVALAANDKPAVAAARIARRANAELFRTSAGPRRAMVRVGVAVAPRHGRTAHLLLQRADEALSQTSENGERVVVYSTDEAAAETRRRDAWVADEIVAALNARRLILAFQPVVAVEARLPSFEEALMRLSLEDGTTLGPDAVIPVAEKLGLIELIDERVLELAVARLAAEPLCRLSMNASMASLRAAEWVDRLRDRLGAAPGAAERLTVEIVETQAVENVAEIAGVLARIKSLGVRVAMDDFGAGHTSFRNLRSLGVDMVKIDGAFVAGLATSVDDRFFVRTLASLARHLGILTVAERVEDAESARLLREWGVDYLQGHFIGRAETKAAAREKARA